MAETSNVSRAVCTSMSAALSSPAKEPVATITSEASEMVLTFAKAIGIEKRRGVAPPNSNSYSGLFAETSPA